MRNKTAELGGTRVEIIFRSATMNLQQFEIFSLLGLAGKWVLGSRGIRARQD